MNISLPDALKSFVDEQVDQPPVGANSFAGTRTQRLITALPTLTCAKKSNQTLDNPFRPLHSSAPSDLACPAKGIAELHSALGLTRRGHKNEKELGGHNANE